MARILWADDEIELLKPHIMYLEQKGHAVHTVNNGRSAIDVAKNEFFDIVFLDENMPGLSGLDVIQGLKAIDSTLPIVMITKSEEEHIMESAIGSKISDYLIKPVNPSQIVLTIKKNLDEKRLISEKTTNDYRQEFREISMQLSQRMSTEEWKTFFSKMVMWSEKLRVSGDEGLLEIFQTQRKEANEQFVKFIKQEYPQWMKDFSKAPLLSNTLFRNKIAPVIQKSPESVFVLVIDNLRFDQWKMLAPHIKNYFRIEEEELFFSILPTATHYARNALFSGLMPSEMEKVHPQWWKNEDDEGGKTCMKKIF